jgi:hypothetical protein
MRILGNRDIEFAQRVRRLGPAWVWLISLAFTFGVALIVVACTVHNRCSNSDPACIFHSYTLVHTAGPVVLAFVGAPALISALLAILLRIKVTRRNVRADRAAWVLAAVSFAICVLGVTVEGLLMPLEGVLTVCAVATTPFPADPNDRYAQSGPWLRRTPPSA